jgi:type VI secretion system secreted protein Hcp
MAKIDYYLQIDRVVGECQVPRFLNWIPLLAYSFDDRQSVALGSGRSTGKVQIQTFHFTMEANRASPKLYLACAQGSPIKWAKLECV